MPPAYHDEAKRLVGGQVSAIIAGGAARSDSVRNALAHIAARYDQAETGVLIHDAARPLVTRRIIADCMAALERARRDRHRGPDLGHDPGRAGRRLETREPTP